MKPLVASSDDVSLYKFLVTCLELLRWTEVTSGYEYILAALPCPTCHPLQKRNHTINYSVNQSVNYINFNIVLLALVSVSQLFSPSVSLHGVQLGLGS